MPIVENMRSYISVLRQKLCGFTGLGSRGEIYPSWKRNNIVINLEYVYLLEPRFLSKP